MPRLKGSGKGVTQAISVRFDPATFDHLKSLAHKNGTSLGEFLRVTIMRGITMETVESIEERLTNAARGAGVGMSEKQLMALFLSQEILTQIAGQRDADSLALCKERARELVREHLEERNHG